MKSGAKMLRKLGLLFSTLLLVVASFALSASPAAAETYTVKMGADNGMLNFVPSTVEVKPGDKIKWENNKLAPHNAVFADSSAKSMSHKQLLFSPGESYVTEVPDDLAPGSYEFYCEPHRGAGMVGKLIVK